MLGGLQQTRVKIIQSFPAPAVWRGLPLHGHMPLHASTPSRSEAAGWVLVLLFCGGRKWVSRGVGNIAQDM